MRSNGAPTVAGMWAAVRCAIFMDNGCAKTVPATGGGVE
jgi:hypothetical protein